MATPSIDASRVLSRSLGYGSPIVRVSTTALTLAGTQNSIGEDVTGPQNISLAVTWTGTPVGTLQLQASGDNSSWENLGASFNFGGGASMHVFNVTGRAFQYFRLQTVLSSGSGTISVANLYGEVI